MQAFILWFQLRWQALQGWFVEAKSQAQKRFKSFARRSPDGIKDAPPNKRWLKRILKWSGYSLLALIGLFILIVIIL